MALFLCFTACLLLSAVLTEAGYCQTYCQKMSGGACIYCRRPTFGKRVQTSTKIFSEIDRSPNLFEKDGLIDLPLRPEDKCILTTSLLEEMSTDARQRVIETIFKALNEK
ncbi:uncharacterized protein [Apostichopus japonicus]|uniref:uncharacterized protein isoform X2 n=1 Tax=Stichopus japonicus TaxID=307972 RepID=UPI003AB2B9A1